MSASERTLPFAPTRKAVRLTSIPGSWACVITTSPLAEARPVLAPIARSVIALLDVEVELGRGDPDRIAGVAHRALLVRVEVAVGAADDDPDLDHRARLVVLALELADRPDGLDLAHLEVLLEFVGVVVEVLHQIIRVEDAEDVVGLDDRGGLLALGGVDRAVGGCDQRAHGHRR